MHVAHTGQLSSSTQPANFAKVKQIDVLHADLVNQCLELAVIQAAGEDGVDNLHHNRHDVNEVGRLGAQSLLVIDAVHLVYGLGVSGGPDCNVIAEQGGGPDVRLSWVGSGPRAGGCPPSVGIRHERKLSQAVGLIGNMINGIFCYMSARI